MSIDDPSAGSSNDTPQQREEPAQPIASTSALPALPQPLDPRNDPTIFQPNGLIHFPRSDGDPSFGPPNTVVPPPSAREVNYYHVFSPDERSYQRWCNVIGLDLAEWAGKGRKPPEGETWRLASFPRDYTFTEQRKGPRESPRTDPYLFGMYATPHWARQSGYMLTFTPFSLALAQARIITVSARAKSFSHTPSISSLTRP